MAGHPPAPRQPLRRLDLYIFLILVLFSVGALMPFECVPGCSKEPFKQAHNLRQHQQQCSAFQKTRQKTLAFRQKVGGEAVTRMKTASLAERKARLLQGQREQAAASRVASGPSASDFDILQPLLAPMAALDVTMDVDEADLSTHQKSPVEDVPMPFAGDHPIPATNDSRPSQPPENNELQAQEPPRPYRHRRLPARYRDILPEQAPVVVGEAMAETTEQDIPLRRVRLIVRDTVTTARNAFGLWRRYLHRPSFDPDHFVPPHTLADFAAANNNSNPSEDDDDSSLYAGFKNMTHMLLSLWLNSGSSTKSDGEAKRLVETFRHKDFSLEDARTFNPVAANRQQDKDDHLNGFRQAVLTIEVPSGLKDKPLRKEDIIGLHYRTLLSIIITAFGPEALLAPQYHLSPFELYHTDEAGHTQRVFSELYNTDAFIQANDKVQRASLHPDDADCKRERVVAALMFWSDSTHLANFGTAKLWPIYLLLGNLSKYARAHPSADICHHVAYIPSLPDSFQDMMKDYHEKWRTQSKEILAQCRREIMHAVWNHLLDDEFLHAYKYGVVVKCHDGVERRIYPRIFTYSADYPEKVLLATIKDKGNCPCPRCLIPKEKLSQMGTRSDLRFRLRNPRKYLAGFVEKARKLIYEQGAKIGGAMINRLLFATSSVPVKNAFINRLGEDFDVHSMLVVDFMHEFELGVWKAFFTHLIRILHAAGSNDELVATLNERYRQVPTFGTTIRKFANNASEMKKLAARDFEDLLQCSIPVFEDLLPEPYNSKLMKLLFRMCEFHAFAKLRMHTESSLEHFEKLTTDLGKLTRDFEKCTSSEFATFELPREVEARRRRQQQQDPAGTNSAPGPKPAQRRNLNLNTYKWHALGDYFRTIRLFGCLDGFSTQVGELAHRLVKRLYSLTNKRHAEGQIAKRYRRIQRAKLAFKRHQKLARGRQGGRATDLTSPDDTKDEDPDRKFYISKSQNTSILLHTLARGGLTDPALKNFKEKLHDHLLGRLLNRDFDGDTHETFSDDERNTIHIHGQKIYSVKTARFFYTSYDVQRESDFINVTHNRDIMMRAPPPDTNEDAPQEELFWYARVLGVFHARVSSSHPDVRDGNELHSMPFLWVRWFGAEPGYRHGFYRARLPKIGFVPATDDYAFGFVDPKHVIRSAHIIPSFVDGRTMDLLPYNSSQARLKGESDDWCNFYVNLFVDRDMVLRHFGGGIGHAGGTLQAASEPIQAEQNSNPLSQESDDEDIPDPQPPEDIDDDEIERLRQVDEDEAAVAQDGRGSTLGAPPSDSSESESESESSEGSGEDEDDDGYASF